MQITRDGDNLVVEVDLAGEPVAVDSSLSFYVERVVEGSRVHHSNNDMRVEFRTSIALDKLAGEVGAVESTLRINKPDPTPHAANYNETGNGFTVTVPGMATAFDTLGFATGDGLDLVQAGGFVGASGEGVSCETGFVGASADGPAFLTEGRLECYAKDDSGLAMRIPDGATMGTFAVAEDGALTVTRTEEMPGFLDVSFSSAYQSPKLAPGDSVTMPRAVDPTGQVAGHWGYVELYEDPATCSSQLSTNPFSES